MSKIISAVDLFCGAGGTSTGLLAAADELGLQVDLTAINHWSVAINTHTANHSKVRHLCEDLDNVNPRRLFPGGRLDIMVASPECVFHSNARGGRPINDQLRASAWHILRWAEALRIDNILIENVKEFRNWGPLGANMRPLKSRKGETFQAFIGALRSLGYNVEYKILNAANYGDPTTRERLFIMARIGNKKINWPAPSHTPTGEKTLFGKTKKWRSAKDIIDWNIKGESIFHRKRPLAPKTMERIIEGLRKFGGKQAEPFIVILRNHLTASSIKKPLPTITAGGTHLAMCEPFVLGQQSCATPRSVKQPLPTIATGGAISLIEPFIFANRTNNKPRSVKEPIPTLCTGNHIALVEPFLVTMEHGGCVRDISRPLPTITTSKGGSFGVVEPYLVCYYGTSKTSPISRPLPAVATKNHFGLVELDGIDIRFRMLRPQELARGMSFPDTYKFEGNQTEVTKQIGNAVPIYLAKALCRSIFAGALDNVTRLRQPGSLKAVAA